MGSLFLTQYIQKNTQKKNSDTVFKI